MNQESSIMSRCWCFAVSLAMSVLLLCAGDAWGGGYVVLTGGEGSSKTLNAESVGAEGGWHGRRLLLGIGFSVAFTEGPWRLVTSNHLANNSEKRNDEVELYAAVGLAVLRHLYLVGTMGGAEESKTGRTRTPSGATVEWDPETTGRHLTFSGQLQYELGWLVVGGGYHNRRGAVGRVGVRF
jgi:hypothetical protein